MNPESGVIGIMGDHAADKIEVADESPLVNGEAEADLPVLIVGAGDDHLPLSNRH